MKAPIFGMSALVLLAILFSCGGGEKKPLYWAHPDDSDITTNVAVKDQMGRDYIPVFEDKTKPILYYVHPMDPKIHSDKKLKDDMGMDYLPVYEIRKPASTTSEAATSSAAASSQATEPMKGHM